MKSHVTAESQGLLKVSNMACKGESCWVGFYQIEGLSFSSLSYPKFIPGFWNSLGVKMVGWTNDCWTICGQNIISAVIAIAMTHNKKKIRKRKKVRSGLGVGMWNIDSLPHFLFHATFSERFFTLNTLHCCRKAGTWQLIIIQALDNGFVLNTVPCDVYQRKHLIIHHCIKILFVIFMLN